MILGNFITKQYETVSPNEKMADAVCRFEAGLFLVVVSRENKPVSLISYYDFLVNPHGLVKDCNLDKPRLDSKDSVISNIIIQYTSRALLIQKLTAQFKSSIAQILGLISNLKSDTCERERKEIKSIINSTCRSRSGFLRVNLPDKTNSYHLL